MMAWRRLKILPSLSLNFKKVLIWLLPIGLAIIGLVLGGCSAKDAAQKYNLTGQLKKINQEVESLNSGTADLVDTLTIMDTKEGGLEESKTLLSILREKTECQVNTSREIAEIVGLQRERVASVLSIALKTLRTEERLRAGTERQMGIAGRTLDLIRLLYGNLNAFGEINQAINGKMDRALQIMREM